MANPITSDNFLTKTAPNRQNVDGANTDGLSNPAASNQVKSEKTTRGSDASEQASLERARQRLSQDLGSGSENAPQTREQARALVAGLGTRLATDPQAGLSAHGEISPDLYSAATARPNA